MATDKRSPRSPRNGDVRIVSPASGPVASPAVPAPAADVVADAIGAPTAPPAPPADASGKFAGFAFTFIKKGGRTAGSVNGSAAEVERPDWSADLRRAADLIGFRLPEFYPARRDRKDGRKAPWKLCAMPTLEALYQPIPPRGSADRDTAALVEGILYGFDGLLPSMVDGEGLPLIDVLRIFANPTVWDTYLKSKALHSLTPYSVNGKNPQHTTCLLYRLAEKSNRYCYVDGETLFITDKADS